MVNKELTFEAMKELLRGKMGVMGWEGKVGPRGPRGFLGLEGRNGRDGSDGTNGKDGAKGDKGDKGDPGKSSDISEFKALADGAVGDHEKEYDHKLIHNPKILGTKEIDESNFDEGRILKVKGGKLVYATLPKGERDRFTSGTSFANIINARLTVETKTSDYTMATTDGLILVDAAGGNITITLPSAVGIKTRAFRIKRIDSTLTNSVTVACSNSETIDGFTTYPLVNQFSIIHVVSDDTNWQQL